MLSELDRAIVSSYRHILRPWLWLVMTQKHDATQVYPPCLQLFFSIDTYAGLLQVDSD